MKMADGDVPAMGKIYKRMFDAIEDLRALKDSELSKARREAMVEQAEKRWEYLDHPLHVAGYALDPEHHGVLVGISSSSMSAVKVVTPA
jgi:hypothetical protein